MGIPRVQYRAEGVTRLVTAMPPGKVITARELAECLGCSPRSIKDWVRRARDAGHTIRSEPGVGYMLMRFSQ